MRSAKVAITLDESLVKRLDRMVEKRIFPSRSKAIQTAVEEKLNQIDRLRLARESAKLVPATERVLADEGGGEITSD